MQKNMMNLSYPARITKAQGLQLLLSRPGHAAAEPGMTFTSECRCHSQPNTDSQSIGSAAQLVIGSASGRVLHPELLSP